MSQYRSPIDKPLTQEQIKRLNAMPFNRGPRPKYYADGEWLYLSKPWIDSLPHVQELLVMDILEGKKTCFD